MTNKSRPKLISISDKAAKKILELLNKKDDSPLGVKIEIKPGGCTAFSYHLKYVYVQDKFDEVVEEKGVKVFIDPKAMMYLINTNMDYIEGRLESGFTFSNPNEKTRCGCGKSVGF